MVVGFLFNILSFSSIRTMVADWYSKASSIKSVTELPIIFLSLFERSITLVDASLYFVQASSALNINPYGASAGNTGEIRLQELEANGDNYTGIKAPDSLTASVIYTLPTADATVGNQVLASDGAGNLFGFQRQGRCNRSVVAPSLIKAQRPQRVSAKPAFNCVLGKPPGINNQPWSVTIFIRFTPFSKATSKAS